MKKIICFFCFICTQNFAQKTISKGVMLHDQARELSDKGKFKEAMTRYLSAIKTLEIEKDSLNILGSFANFYGCASITDQTKVYLGFESYILRFVNFNDQMSVYNLLSLGQAYRSKGDFEKANNYFEKAQSKYEKIPNKNHRLKGVIFYHLGSLAMDFGDYFQAAIFFKQELNEFSQCKKDEIVIDEVASANLKLAQSFQKIENYAQAKKYFLEAKKIATLPIVLSNIQNGQIDNFFALNQPDSTENLIRSTFKIQQKNNFSTKLSKTYLQLGEWLFFKQKYSLAIDTLTKNIALQTANHDKLGLGKTHQLLAKIYAKENNFSESLAELQKSLISLSDNFSSTDFRQNPTEKQVHFKVEALAVFSDKIKILLQKNEPLIAFQSAKIADQLIDNQRLSFQIEGSKLFLTNASHEIYLLAIQASYLLFRQTKNEFYISQAFRFSERNKAVELSEAIKSSKIQRFNGVPDTLLLKEFKLNHAIAVLENLINRDEKKKQNQMAEWQNKLILESNELAKLKEKFKENYPKYFQFKYENEPISISEIQSELASDQALVEYFLGSEKLYCFVISDNSITLEEKILPKDFSVKIKQFRQVLQGGREVENLLKLGHFFHDFLVKSLENLPKIKQVFVVSDGELNVLPFETFVMKNTNSLKEPNIFLIEKYDISYAHSASLLFKNVFQQEDKSLIINYLAFAPKYLSPNDLPNNRAMVQQISAKISGKTFLADEATLQNFDKNLVNHFKVLHLSMHGGGDVMNPNKSYLVFAKNDTLFAPEIYGRSIAADMALLDACETGVGQINQGEGLMNLARAFIHSGCRSVTMSLWKLRSQPETAELIEDFVNLIENGTSRNVALRQAKLNYLHKNRQNLVLAHPANWAALVLVGDYQALENRHNYFIYGTICLVALLFFQFRKKLLKSYKTFFS